MTTAYAVKILLRLKNFPALGKGHHTIIMLLLYNKISNQDYLYDFNFKSAKSANLYENAIGCHITLGRTSSNGESCFVVRIQS